ncbi:MAG: hypothetical protein JW793_10615 [Acidobacteria bacterium]|nr:hypothetical protein [Acidobacteriota bacterium]
MDTTHRKNALRMLALSAGLLIYPIAAIQAAVLNPETAEAWDAYVSATEARIGRELESEKGFLAGDFTENVKDKSERNKVLSGEIPVAAMESTGENATRIEISRGRIHHWRGAIFVPGVTLGGVLSRIENPVPADMEQEDVLESRVLEHSPVHLKVFLKLQRSKIITVVYNTEHRVRFERHGPYRASSRSHATKIAEVERLDGNREREKPEGNDHGFLWRMNSYWRYEETDGGVIVECESITLSRSVPAVLEFMIRPLIKKVARESMERTLVSMRERLIRNLKNAQNGAAD